MNQGGTYFVNLLMSLFTSAEGHVFEVNVSFKMEDLFMHNFLDLFINRMKSSS